MNQIALVTGGSRGIGRSIVRNLATRSIDVILTYRERADEARAVVAEVERDSAGTAKAFAVALDVARPATFGDVAAEVQRLLAGRPLDYIVNNAGSGGGGVFAEVTEAQLNELLAVHFKGPFLLTQKLVPLMADGGAIVNITTGLTRYTHPGVSAYASAKAATEAWTRQLARELGPRRIAVNAVAPGGIETDFGGGLMKNADVQSFVASATPYGRVGKPDDIGGLVALLVDPATRWMTGQRLELTGGYAL